jgi:hypothetical protein
MQTVLILAGKRQPNAQVRTFASTTRGHSSKTSALAPLGICFLLDVNEPMGLSEATSTGVVCWVCGTAHF